jgi:hypothetical protein
MSYSFIIATSQGSSDGAGFTTTGIDTTGANLLVVVVSDDPGEAGVLTDSKSNSWTPLNSYQNAGGDQVQMYYCSNPTVGVGHTFSITGTINNPSLSIGAFSGSTAAPFDQQNGASVANGVNALSTGSITPGENDELIVATFSGGGSLFITGLAIDSGFTIASNIIDTGEHYATAICYKIQTTAEAINPQFTWTDDGSAAASIASFKAAPGSNKLLVKNNGDFVGGVQLIDRGIIIG